MSTMALQSHLRQSLRQFTPEFQPVKCRKDVPFSIVFNSNRPKFGGSSYSFKPQRSLPLLACSATSATTSQPAETVYDEAFQLRRIEKVEGKLHIRLDQKEGDHWQLTVGCSLPGKWVLHWGVHYVGVDGSEWDLPPDEMRPPGSIAIKDYAIETPLIKSALEGEDCMHEVKVDFNCNSNIAAINFVLKDEETGLWYQHKGRDYMVPLVHYLRDGDNVIGPKSSFSSSSGTFGHLFEAGGAEHACEDVTEASAGSTSGNRLLTEFHEEQPIIKEIPVCNSLNISVTKCPETANSLVYLETDLPTSAVVHWGVCQGRNEKWEVPAALHQPDTEVFRSKALRTRLQAKEDGCGSKALFTLGEEIPGFAFVLKLSEDTWLNNRGDNFYIPLSAAQTGATLSSEKETQFFTEMPSGLVDHTYEKYSEANQEALPTTNTDGIIKDMRHLVKGGNKEALESVIRELDMLAAEAHGLFSRTAKTFPEETAKESELKPPAKITSGTGSGFEILCQGFNWESHKSGRWYMELQEKAAHLSSMGFTVIWLPPPTESVSPEGYMPKDLYNLNSRYGTIDELKSVVNKFHEFGIKVLGDVVLNHRCAHYQNQSGVWNIFGGPLNWDDRAVVSDDPHFQGRGNKSSGDNFHAAPNIDHSQDFVRRDIKNWLCWLRRDIGYDGWRLDFVRGFWGGYVKDYIDASQPYFAVGEFWDSLSYTYGEMDHNQDAHRQRIIDWINAAGGTAGAFDVTTKGILHSVLEKCEYWRLSDQKGKSPGVVGWWPSRAVTFIENHDTGSTQGHWRFPSGKEMQGYAYILTHPGTPSVFYDHIFSHYQSDISALMSFRTRKNLHCRSAVKITKAESDVYAAIIDDKVAMKIGPGHYEPPSGPQHWSLAIEGRDYKVWEAV